jgi:hypothetical protein
VTQDEIERGGEGRRISGRHEQPRFAVGQGDADFADVAGHDGTAGEHGLEQRERQAFRQRREHEHVGRREDRRNVGAKTEQVHAVRDAEVAGARRQRLRQLPTAADGEMELRVPPDEQRHGVDEAPVPLHGIQIAHRHEKPVAGAEAQLFPERDPFRPHVSDAVGYGRDARAGHPEVPAQVLRQGDGHGHRPGTRRNRRAHRQPAAQAGGVVAAPVHRHDMRDSRSPGRPRAVNGHGELVAVCDRDPVSPQGPFQEARIPRRDRSVQPEILDGDPRPIQLAGEPALPVGGKEHDVPRAGGLQRAREVRDDALRPSGSVGLDEVRDPQAGEGIGHHALRRACRPPVQAS